MKPDDIDFQFRHEKHSWTLARLSIAKMGFEYDATEHVFHLTYLWDSPAEVFVNAMLKLAEGKPHVAFTVYTEPGRFDWTFSLVLNAHHLDQVEIRYYSEDHVEEGQNALQLISFVVKRSFWLKLVQAELGKLMLLASDEDYAKDRHVEALPWDAMHALCGKIPA
ncbi:hypothetical protein [Armatimonas sp.]|uniref:hypothetical protein n=1 Tax=Armatimonas sp. TaxID=1872638 RepID=UPI00286B3E61|nr:hypothetical protein [Armatimonas sp.]